MVILSAVEWEFFEQRCLKMFNNPVVVEHDMGLWVK